MKRNITVFGLAFVFILSIFSLTFAYTPGSVQVIVSDFDNSSLLSGAIVKMDPGNYTGITDINGSVTFSNIIPYRNYTVEATLDNYVEGAYGQGRTGLIWVESGQTAAANVPLVKKSIIQGQATNGSIGIENAMVVLTRNPLLPGMGSGDEFVASVLTDSNGNYILPKVAAGKYKIVAVADSYHITSVQNITIASGDILMKNFTLTPGTPTLPFTIGCTRCFYGRSALISIDPTPNWSEVSNAYMCVSSMPQGAEAPIEEFGIFTPSLPGYYTVALVFVDSAGVGSLSIQSLEMTNFATEAYPSVIPGPSVLPLIYDNGTLFANSSGTPSVLPGEDVYLRGWGRDFNLPSPEMFDAQAFEHDNATWGLFDIYGNKNGDWSQSEFSFTWSLRDNFDNDTTYLLSSTDTQNTHFKVPDNATAGDEYIATLTVTGDDGLADAGKEIHIYVASMAPRAGSNNTCANNCHGTIRSIFVSTAHRTVANLDCQDCHGPGSLHIPLRDPKYVPVSHWPGICGKCHTQFAEWQKSRHSDPPAFGHAEIASNTSYSLLVNCYKCHYTDGYIGAVESGLWFSQFEYPLFGTGTPEYIPEDTPNVGCDVCHDPHDQTNPLGLRTWNKEGYPCQTCHVEKWQNATYTALGDLIENAYHWDDYSQYEGPYDNETGTGNPHYQSKACVLCHMANDITDTDSFGVKKVGGHTMKMRDVGADGDPDTGDDLLNIVVCQGCHSGLTTFDRNGVRTRIKNKLNNLGDLLKANNHEFLPPFQPGKCAKCHRGGTLPFINESSLQVFEKAYTNYKLVLHDRSFGIHNPGYIERLLDDSIAQAENAWKICVADLDCSKTVNSFDLLIMKLDYNKKNCIQDNETYCCQADIDNSTKVDSHDLLLMKLDYNKKDCFPCVAPCLF